VIREAYESVAAVFVDTVAQICEPLWHQPGLGVWTVRDLVGHTSRALLTVETYLAQSAPHADLARPIDYYLQARMQTQATLAAADAIAARGRQAGEALGADPAQAVRDIATRVLAAVRVAADNALVGTPLGGMRLIDYLPSRIFELAVHTLDIAHAVSLAVTLPETAARVTVHLLADAALESGKVAPLLLAATGRQPLPDGYSVL